ncbi:stannin cytoplasmic [Caudoviricetes sp.]|nr:stannin cytoplasmic [Caudoviricetes sp.]
MTQVQYSATQPCLVYTAGIHCLLLNLLLKRIENILF